MMLKSMRLSAETLSQQMLALLPHHARRKVSRYFLLFVISTSCWDTVSTEAMQGIPSAATFCLPETVCKYHGLISFIEQSIKSNRNLHSTLTKQIALDT